MPSSFCFDSDGRKAVYTSSGVWKELKEGGTEDDEIVSALKDYYVAIGGNAETVESITTIYDMIEAISSISSYGLPDVSTEDEGDILAVDASGKWAKAEPESGLPDVSASDNGDILAVVEGAWAKKTPDSGDGARVINGSYNVMNGQVTLEMSPSEIFANGDYSPVIIKAEESVGVYHYFYMQQTDNGSGANTRFLNMYRSDTSVRYMALVFDKASTSKTFTSSVKVVNDPA